MTNSFAIHTLRSIFLLASLCTALFVNAQEEELVKQWKKDKDYYLIDSLVRNGENIYAENPDKSIAIWKDVVKRSDVILKKKKGSVRRGITILKGDATSNIAFVYHMKGNIPMALKYDYLAIAIREKAHDKHGVAESNNNMGYAFMDQGDTVSAIKAYVKSGKIYQEIKDYGGVAYSNINLSRVYFAAKRYDEALAMLRKAQFLLDSLNQFTDAEASAVNLQAEIYYKRGDIDSAMLLNEKALDIAISSEDPRTIGGIYANQANYYFLKNNISKAKELALLAVEYAGKADVAETKRAAADILGRVYIALGDFKRGHEFYKMAVDIKEKIRNENNKKDMVRKQFEYQYDKKMSVVKSKQLQENKLREAERKNERTKRYALFGCLALLLVFVGFVYNRFRITRKQNVIIEEQKKLVEERNKEVRDSILYARKIQSALLAHTQLLNRHMPEHFVMYKPKDIVSGDFYWATSVGSRFYLAVCDSTGHGVPGAFMSLLNISFLNEAINEKNIIQPDLILNYVRQRLIENIAQDRALNDDGSFDVYGGRDGMDGALLCFEAGSKKITYASAHIKPMIHRNGEFIELPCDKMPVGKSDFTQNFSLHSFTLHAGDALYIYTDGLSDQFGGDKGKKFKTSGIKTLLQKITGDHMQTQREMLASAFEAWKGDLEQIDDVCVVGIRF